MMKGAQIAQAMQELEEEAERLAETDPRAAVEALEKLAGHVGREVEPMRSLREQQVAAYLEAREIHASAETLASLGPWSVPPGSLR